MSTGARFGIWLPHHGYFGSPDYPGDRPDASYRRSRDLALLAESIGFDSLLIAQQTISTRRDGNDVLEPWSAAAGIAETTSSIEIIAAIKPFLFNPGLLAKIALGIDEISRGRFGINLVSGWFLPEMERLGIRPLDHDERYRYAADWLSVVRGLLAGETVTDEGDYGRVQDLALRPGPLRPGGPTVYLGGESTPAKELAASAADAYFINGRPPDAVRELMDDVASRDRAGRPPLRYALSAFVIARPTTAEAHAELNRFHALRQSDPNGGRPIKGTDPATQMLKVEFAAEPIGTNGGTAAGLVGSYAEVADRIDHFTDLGIDLFMLQFQPLEAEVQRFAEHVRPLISPSTTRKERSA